MDIQVYTIEDHQMHIDGRLSVDNEFVYIDELPVTDSIFILRVLDKSNANAYATMTFEHIGGELKINGDHICYTGKHRIWLYGMSAHMDVVNTH